MHRENKRQQYPQNQREPINLAEQKRQPSQETHQKHSTGSSKSADKSNQRKKLKVRIVGDSQAK